jgi:hypothetical protein
VLFVYHGAETPFAFKEENLLELELNGLRMPVGQINLPIPTNFGTSI